MPNPHEVVSGPATLYVADALTSIPEISEDPPAAWVTVGLSGAHNYSDDGVSIQMSQTLEKQFVEGSTGAIKSFRKDESLMFTITLVDLTSEAFALALGRVTVTTQVAASGEGGYQQIALLRGNTVPTFAVLVRGQSPYENELYAAQYWCPLAYIDTDNINPSFKKGEATMLEVSFNALADRTNGFGLIQLQDAAALP